MAWPREAAAAETDFQEGIFQKMIPIQHSLAFDWKGYGDVVGGGGLCPQMVDKI